MCMHINICVKDTNKINICLILLLRVLVFSLKLFIYSRFDKYLVVVYRVVDKCSKMPVLYLN